MLLKPEDILPIEEVLKLEEHDTVDGRDRVSFKVRDKLFSISLNLNVRCAESKKVKEYLRDFDELEVVIRKKSSK